MGGAGSAPIAMNSAPSDSASKGRGAGEELVEDDAERPDVGAGVDAA